MESQTEWNKIISKRYDIHTYDPSLGDGDAAYQFFGTRFNNYIQVNSDRDMELLPRLTINCDKDWGKHDLNDTCRRIDIF